MPDIIQLLPDHVANQIAAGEVVQRPASVVKELLENAIDAGASQIHLIIKEAGKTLIQVVDNGIGMSSTDARLSFERHATSKIKKAEDLFNLHTKGFRGEALASIAAIAQVELKTKTENQEVGTTIKIEGSKVIAQEVAVVPKGTSIAVKNLFFNIPARRNFLKSNPVETRHIIDEFQRVALAHPTIAFEMQHNGSLVFNLPASNLRQRITNILGNKSNEKLVPIEEETPLVKIKGFIVKPAFARKSRGEQFFFVNHRFIKSGYLHHGVSSAFEGLLKNDHQPGYFIFLEVPPQKIDINIHPTKTEIKFEDEHAIYAVLRATVKHSLGQFSIAPVLDFNKDASLDTPYSYHNKDIAAPRLEVNKNFNPFEETKSNFSAPSQYKRDKVAHWQSLYTVLNQETIKNQQEVATFNAVELESEQNNTTLFTTHLTERKFTFQIQNKYIISPVKSGLLVIHQNLAHQRVLYEELLKSITVQEAVSQQLLFPLTLSLSTSKFTILKNLKEALIQTGFAFSKFEKNNVEIKGIPVGIIESSIEEILDNLVNDFENEVPDHNYSANDLLAKSLAKSMAIKSGTNLNIEEQEHLINKLFACKEPSVAPNNKPLLFTYTVDDFERQLNKK